jgi:hypothetical protein
LPALDQLGQQYAEREFVILAVNVGDSRPKYENYVEAQDYRHLQWARDGSGQVVDLYEVRGIPVTYILDQEGVIRYAHVGYGDGMAEVFAREIGSLFE